MNERVKLFDKHKFENQRSFWWKWYTLLETNFNQVDCNIQKYLYDWELINRNSHSLLSLTCLIRNKCLKFNDQNQFYGDKNKAKFPTILNIHKIPRFPYHDTTLHLVVTWYLVLSLRLDWKPLLRACAVRIRQDFRISIHIVSSELNAPVCGNGFPRNYLRSHFGFFSIHGLMKGFSLLVSITGPPQCITRAHYGHYTPVTALQQSVLCVLPRSGHQRGLSEAGSGDWRLACQHYNLTTRPAASICRTCVFPSIRQHLTTLIHTFGLVFTSKLSSFSVTIKPELW